MLLPNDRAQFTSYSNLFTNTNTNNLNCFDILLTSQNIPALSKETFHTLKCILQENVFDKEVEIEFEVE